MFTNYYVIVLEGKWKLFSHFRLLITFQIFQKCYSYRMLKKCDRIRFGLLEWNLLFFNSMIIFCEMTNNYEVNIFVFSCCKNHQHIQTNKQQNPNLWPTNYFTVLTIQIRTVPRLIPHGNNTHSGTVQNVVPEA